MTLDQLILDYDQAKANAAGSGSDRDRQTYGDLADYYARRISDARGKSRPAPARTSA